MNKQLQQQPVWCFRRWSRKPWSAFAGLCRLKIGVLSVAMSIILLATHVAGAQTTGTDSLSVYRTLHLDSVQITAHRGSMTAIGAAVSQPRTIVDHKASLPVQTIESALRLLPELDIRERGGKSIQTDIAIRGGSFDQTMAMLNGVDFSDARTGHQSHALPVDIDILSDISVVDVTSQPGALSGAVDLRTHSQSPYTLRVRLEGGAWGYGYENISGGWNERFRGGDRLSVVGAASYRRSDGYRPNTDFWNINAYSRVVYDSPHAGRLDIQGGFQHRDWGSNGFYSLRYPMQFESTLTGLASAKWSKQWGRFTLTAWGAFRQNNDRFEMVRGVSDPALGGIPFNYHTTCNASGEVHAAYDWRRAETTSLGVNFIHHRLLSSAMGEALSDPSHRIPGQDALYPKGKNRTTVSAWAAHRKSWHRGWVQGLASVIHTPYGTDGTFAVETEWSLGRFLSLGGGVFRSVRLPTFTDLYYNVATYHPDPNLKPEKAMTYRLTLRSASFFAASDGSGGLRASASVYYRHTSGVIDWEQRPDPDPEVDGHWWSTQLNRLGTAGAELSVNYSSHSGWLRVAMLGYGYVHSDKSVRTGYISKYALDYMRHKVSAIVGVAIPGGFSFTLTGSFYDRVGSYIAADGSQQGYDPYFLLDGRLAWELADRRSDGTTRRTGVQFYIDVTNMTDTRYADFGGLPMPGAWASGGVVITIR